MRSFAITLAAAAVVAAPAAAQMRAADAMPESYRAVQMNALELQRRTLLAMADSMPERLYRDRATPAQRDFAQQVTHAAGAVPMIISSVLRVTPRPSLPDTATALNTRAGLRSFVNACYDYAATALRNQTAAQRAETVNLFGNQMPGWQVWDELHQHTFWTAGQIVANFRKNGMAPPPFGFF